MDMLKKGKILLISTQEIIDYIDAHDIKLVIDKKGILPDSIHGIYLYIKDELPPTIVINCNIDLNTPYGRCVLAEEIGHYETTITKTILNPEQQTFFHRDGYYCVNYSKAEREARIWGAEFLMPTVEFIKTLKEFSITGESIIDYFGVTDEFLKLRLETLNLN